MKLVYVISKYTNANSNYKLHLVNNAGQPWCNSNKRSFSVEYVFGGTPTCKKCFKAWSGDVIGDAIKSERDLPNVNLPEEDKG